MVIGIIGHKSVRIRGNCMFLQIGGGTPTIENKDFKIAYNFKILSRELYSHAQFPIPWTPMPKSEVQIHTMNVTVVVSAGN